MDARIIERLSRITSEEEAILSGQRDIDRGIYMDGSRDIVSGKKLLKPGQLIAIRSHTRFIAFPKHTHDYVEIVYMCSGTTTHTVNGAEIVLREGELLLLGQNARQSIRAAGEQDVAANFIVRPDFFSGILDYLGDEETPLRRFIVNCLGGGSESGYLYFQVADVLPVQNLVENLLWILIEQTQNKRGLNQMTMGLLFAQLMEHTDRLTFSDVEEQAIVRVLRYVEERYQDGSLTELAEEMHYDLGVLSRFIKAHTGKTYTELVQEKRLSQAAWLLRNTDIQVEAVSQAVGYENMSYFHRLFRTRFGTTPKRYRDRK